MMYDEVAFAETKATKKESKGNSRGNQDNPRDNTGDTKANPINPSNKGNEIDAELSMQIEHRVSIENGSTKWLDYEREDTLQNITIKVRPGELIAIVGQVGAGKSSLLNVILKELRLREGSIQVRALSRPRRLNTESKHKMPTASPRSPSVRYKSSGLSLVFPRIREPRSDITLLSRRLTARSPIPVKNRGCSPDR